MGVLIDQAQEQRILQRGFGTVTESGGGACWITFEQTVREITSKSGGKPEYEDVIMAKVHVPGGDVFVKEMDKSGEEWLQRKHGKFIPVYQQFKAGKEQRVPGTPISTFTVLSPAKVKMLESRNVFTIEQLASLSDAHLEDLGMGAREMRKQAQAFLNTAEASDKEMRAIKENEELKAKMESLEKKLAEMAMKEEVDKLAEKDAKKKKE